MKRFTLSRRAVLRGLGGVAVALPVLEIMLDGNRSHADPAPGTPRRYLVCFTGTSLGGDGDSVQNLYVPDNVGKGYDVKAALQPLADAGVTDQVSVVSGLRIPTGPDSNIPPGGRALGFHVKTLSPTFSGVRSTGGEEGQTPIVNGPTSDIIVADAIGGATTFHSLQYRIQASWYLAGSGPYGRELMSYSAQDQGIAPVVSPMQAFNTLFGNFMAPSEDPIEAKRAAFRLKERKSMVDLVKNHADDLVKRLGGADQKRVQQHLDEIRALEKQIAAIPPTASGACAPPTSPGMDPPLGGDNDGASQQGGSGYSTSNGYSNEEERARAFCDLIHMAFTCDLTRSVSLMFTMAQSHMNMYPLTQQPSDLHEVGHNGVNGGDNSTAEVSKTIAWHMKHFAYLVAKMKNTQEGPASLLDSSAIVMLHEGGHGLDPSSGSDNSAHSTENMACLIAGGAGGLKPGQHVVAQDKHPANVLITAMNAVGVATDTLGEVTGAIPELFV